MSRVRVRSDLRVWKKLYNLARKTQGKAVRVGVFDGRNSEIGLVHEFGAPSRNIPARPFIRQTFQRKRAELAQLQAKLAQAIMMGRLDEARAMGMLGAWAAGAIKATITRDGEFAPLKPATIKRKGSDKPLIDTGQLVGAITFVVVD